MLGTESIRTACIKNCTISRTAIADPVYLITNPRLVNFKAIIGAMRHQITG